MKSESIKELASALAKVRFGEIERTKSVKVSLLNGGSYVFQYAPLEEIMSAIRRPLADQGLSITQSVEISEGKVVIESMLMHSSGEWKTSLSPVIVPQKYNKEGKPLDTTAQEFGAAVSYARRYGITLLGCLAADEDDDANIADGNSVEVRRTAFKEAHKPTDGVTEGLSVDLQTVVHDLSNRVRSLASKGDIKGCCDEVDETLDAFDNANEMKVALWAKLSDTSAVRSAMKKEWDSRKPK